MVCGVTTYVLVPPGCESSHEDAVDQVEGLANFKLVVVDLVLCGTVELDAGDALLPILDQIDDLVVNRGRVMVTAVLVGMVVGEELIRCTLYESSNTLGLE